MYGDRIIIKNSRASNLARESCSAIDQRKELRMGCETWGITYSPGNQRGQMSIWPDTGRGAVMYGGDSAWGDWDEQILVLRLDSGRDIDIDGKGIGDDGEE